MSGLLAPRLSAGAQLGTRSPLSTGRDAPPRAWRSPPAWTLTALLALVYLLIAPASPDLAAASYRSYLVAHFGFLLWDDSWYGGHHLPAYSLLAPGLGALIGPRTVAAVSMVGATALFARLIEPFFNARARLLAGYFFAIGGSVALLSSRVPFNLGLALGLASTVLALPALRPSRHARGLGPTPLALGACSARRAPRAHAALAGALLLAVLSAAASPVAGAFLGLCYLACAIVGPRRGRALALLLAALGPVALLALMFPEGGNQPFVASAYYPALAGVLALLVAIPADQRVLRVGTALYALAMTGAYLLPSAVGGNADRLGALTAGPVLACVLGGGSLHGRALSARRLRLLALLAPAYLYWQVNAPIADYRATLGNAATRASYYAPLLRELRSLHIGYGAKPARIEVVPTAAHWEARYLAPAVMIARGWERQLDTYRNGLFYEEDRPLTAARYETWLQAQSVSYVALPDAKLDYSARAEAALLRKRTPSYLREVWRTQNWRLFAVLHPSPLVQGDAGRLAIGRDWFALRAPAAGDYTVRVHFSPYWALASGRGCVAQAPGQWTQVQARAPGYYRVVIEFSLARIFSRGRRCA